MKKWVNENKSEPKAILLYSLYQPIAKSILRIRKKYNIPCFVIVPDLPAFMFTYSRRKKLFKFLEKMYIGETEKIKSHFDGYIYFDDEKITEVTAKEYPVSETYDMTGYYVSPGFVDIHYMVNHICGRP